MKRIFLCFLILCLKATCWGQIEDWSEYDDDNYEVVEYSDELLLRAQNGDPDAQYDLANCLADGLGIDADIEEALIWYKKSAEQGNEDASYSLSRALFNLGRYEEIIALNHEIEGLGQDYVADSYYQLGDYQSAMKYYQDVNLWYQIAKCYQSLGQEENYIHFLYIQLRNKSQRDAVFELSSFFPDESAGKELLLSMANTVLVTELHIVEDTVLKEGTIVIIQEAKKDAYGNYLSIDYDECSMQELIELADQNDELAQYELSERYAYGDGIEVNADEWRKWVTMAARNGYAPAQFDLGHLVVDGQDEQENVNDSNYTEEDINWIQLAASQDYAPALELIGDLYLTGEYYDKNYDEAFKWYQRAYVSDDESETVENKIKALQGDIAALYEVGREFDEINWIRRSADQGYLPAICEMGDIYRGVYRNAGKFEGTNLFEVEVRDNQLVQRDYTESLRWYHMAAEAGDGLSDIWAHWIESMLDGDMFYAYLLGTCISDDYSFSDIDLVRKAAKNGCIWAQYELSVHSPDKDEAASWAAVWESNTADAENSSSYIILPPFSPDMVEDSDPDEYAD